jgi:hypothetical protein
VIAEVDDDSPIDGVAVEVGNLVGDPKRKV